MDATRFDYLARSLSTAGARRGLLALLPALPIVGLLLAHFHEEGDAKKRRRRRKAQVRSSRKRKKKVTLCHEGQTIRVKKSKRKKHLRHGDTRGACQPVPPPPPGPPPPPPPGPPPPCTPRTCPAGANCGTIEDGCGGVVTCGGACADPTPDCVENVCIACTSDAQCQGAGLGERCWNGACVCGDVCASGCQFTTVQAAIAAVPDDSTIQLCAETYPRPGDANVASIVGKALTLLGAGAELTILDGGGVSSGHSVVFADQTESVLQDLTVTGALDTTGIFLGAVATLTLAQVTVRDNDNDESGGGITNNGGTVILEAGTIVRENHADNAGGGIFTNGGTVILKAGARVAGNQSDGNGGGINSNFGAVTLEPGSQVCGNDPNQCIGFSDPNGACQQNCPEE